MTLTEHEKVGWVNKHLIKDRTRSYGYYEWSSMRDVIEEPIRMVNAKTSKDKIAIRELKTVWNATWEVLKDIVCLKGLTSSDKVFIYDTLRDLKAIADYTLAASTRFGVSKMFKPGRHNQSYSVMKSLRQVSASVSQRLADRTIERNPLVPDTKADDLRLDIPNVRDQEVKAELYELYHEWHAAKRVCNRTDEDRFFVEQVALRYLPEMLSMFMKFVDSDEAVQAKARELMLTQVRFLRVKLKRITRTGEEIELERLAIHGEFLQSTLG